MPPRARDLKVEGPRAAEVSFRHIHLDRATAQRKRGKARDSGEKVVGDIRRSLSKGVLVCAPLLALQRSRVDSKRSAETAPLYASKMNRFAYRVSPIESGSPTTGS